MFYSFAVFRGGHLSVSHWKNYAVFQAYIEKYPHITPILSIGGWGADGFSQAAATVQGRAAFVEDALKLMREYGFLGVDIDWEYPGSSAAGIQSSPRDRENYTLLLKALRDGLDALTAEDGIPRLLCIALSGSAELIKNLQCPQIGEVVDQVNLMTYDMQNPNLASHHSALYASHPKALSAAAAVEAFILAGIPAGKLMLGAAFYGYRWNTRETEPLYKKATKKDTITYTEIQKLLDKNPAAVFYDDTAQAPYYFDGRVFISYDDTRSITQKWLYAQAQGLLGLFAWQYGADSTGTLVHAMKPE
jgi:chitinase